MDFYLDDENALNRILTEWKHHGKLIIAYDFDDTVFDFFRKGRKYDDVVNLLRRCNAVGAYFIVFTCREQCRFPDVANYLLGHQIPFDKINENLDFIACQMTARKVYYNIFLDDRAGLSSAYNILLKAVEHMEYEKKYERHCV